MPTDTERLDWYFGQERFNVVPNSNRRFFWLFDLTKEPTDRLVERSGNQVAPDYGWSSAREAIDHAMELEKADGD